MYNELIDGNKFTNNRSNRWTMILGWAYGQRLWLPQGTIRLWKFSNWRTKKSPNKQLLIRNCCMLHILFSRSSVLLKNESVLMQVTWMSCALIHPIW